MNLKEQLRNIIEGIGETESLLDRDYRDLGRQLLDNADKVDGSGDFKELLGRAQETRGLIDSSRTNSDRLEKLLGRLEETRQAIQEKNGELGILGEEIEPHFESVGRAAVEALVDDEAEAAPYRKLIDQLRDLEIEIKQIDRELKRGATHMEEGRGIVTQAIAGGRRLYLQGVARTKGLRAAGLYRRLGREVCESDLIARFDSHAFMDVLEPVLKNREQTKKVDMQVSALKNKEDRLEGEIASLCEGERPQRRLQRLENERKKANEVFNLQLRDLGIQFADRRGTSSSVPKGVKSGVDLVKKERRELASLEKRKERVEAAVAIEELERKVDADRTKMRSLENTVRKTNKEIAVVSAEIKELSEERDRLLKIRGAVDDLMREAAGEE